MQINNTHTHKSAVLDTTRGEREGVFFFCSFGRTDHLSWGKISSMKRLRELERVQQLHKPISQPIRRAQAHTDAPVTLIHWLCIHMWSDGAVDTVDRRRGKDGFQKSLPRESWQHICDGWADQSPGTQSGAHTLPTPSHTQPMTNASGLSNFTTGTVFYMADLLCIIMLILIFLCQLSVGPKSGHVQSARTVSHSL